MSEDACRVGFDLGGTKMLAAIYDQSFTEVGRHRRKTKGHEGAERGLRRITETIATALENAEKTTSQLQGIGIGCPGPVDMDKGTLIEAVNLGWRDVELQKQLEDRFQCPVAVLNDVDAGVYGEFRFGAAKGVDSALGVFPGTGIGGGFVYKGEILHGTTSSCMEIGHIRVMADGPKCGCGRYGCLETLASRLAISAAAAQAAYRGEAPYLMKKAGTTLGDIRSGLLADAVAAGDSAVEEIIRRAAVYIGIGVASVMNLVLPDIIVLGGGLVEAMPEIFVKTVGKSIREHIMPAYEETVKVEAAVLGDDAAIRGAVGWVQNQSEANHE